MSKRHPNFRRAQHEGGPYSKRQRRKPQQRNSLLDIICLFASVIAMVWFATPTLHRWWNNVQRTPEQIAKVEQSVYYHGCNDARAAGVAPIHRGEPGYRSEMDGDNDGVACEPYY